MPLLLLTRVDCTHLLGPCDPGVGVAPGSAPQGDVLPLALSHQLVADDHGRGNEDLDLNIERSSTGLLAFSDSVRTAKKCHCKWGAFYCVTVPKHFYCMKVQLGGSEKCHCRRGLSYCVTVTGVTASGKPCKANSNGTTITTEEGAKFMVL